MPSNTFTWMDSIDSPVQRPDRDGGGNVFDAKVLQIPQGVTAQSACLKISAPHICSLHVNAPHCTLTTTDKIEALHIELNGKVLDVARLRGDTLNLSSASDISARLLEGKVHATASNGNIALKKLLATDAVLNAKKASSGADHGGNVSVEAAYASSLEVHAAASFTTQTMHGSLKLELTADSSGGPLFADIEGLKGEVSISASGAQGSVRLQYDECMPGTTSVVHLEQGGSVSARATQPAALQLHTSAPAPGAVPSSQGGGAVELAVPADCITPAAVRGSSRFAPPPPDVAVWQRAEGSAQNTSGDWQPLHFEAADKPVVLQQHQMYPTGAVRMKLLGSAADQAISGASGSHGKIGHSGRHSSGAFYEAGLTSGSRTAANDAFPEVDSDCALLHVSTGSGAQTQVTMGVTGWRDVILQRMARRKAAEASEA